MTKRRLTLYLVVGILAGLFVSACAGEAAGKIDLLGSSQAIPGGPAVRMVSLPSLEIARPALSAQFTFQKAESVAPAEQLQADPVSLEGMAAAQAAVQSQAQTIVYGHSGLCSRGAP
jgi:hypothetical protein